MPWRLTGRVLSMSPPHRGGAAPSGGRRGEQLGSSSRGPGGGLPATCGAGGEREEREAGHHRDPLRSYSWFCL